MNTPETGNALRVGSSVLLCLFVGGRHDGDRLHVPANPTILLPVPGEEHDVYKREHVGADNTEYVIYRHDSITNAEALKMLIDGYRHNAEVSDGGPLTQKPKQANSRRSLD
jgi:hypothetical protein